MEEMQAPNNVPLTAAVWHSIDWACDRYFNDTDSDNYNAKHLHAILFTSRVLSFPHLLATALHYHQPYLAAEATVADPEFIVRLLQL